MAGRFEGKQALVLGVANKRSIAWAIAERLAAEGAQLAFTYQGERIEKSVRDLCCEPLRDCPRDRALVRDPEHERLLPLEPSRHASILKGRGRAWSRTRFA